MIALQADLDDLSRPVHAHALNIDSSANDEAGDNASTVQVKRNASTNWAI